MRWMMYRWWCEGGGDKACWVIESVYLCSPNKGFWACLGDPPPDMPRRPTSISMIIDHHQWLLGETSCVIRLTSDFTANTFQMLHFRIRITVVSPSNTKLDSMCRKYKLGCRSSKFSWKYKFRSRKSKFESRKFILGSKKYKLRNRKYKFGSRKYILEAGSRINSEIRIKNSEVESANL